MPRIVQTYLFAGLRDAVAGRKSLDNLDDLAHKLDDDQLNVNDINWLEDFHHFSINSTQSVDVEICLAVKLFQ